MEPSSPLETVFPPTHSPSFREQCFFEQGLYTEALATMTKADSVRLVDGDDDDDPSALI